MNIMKKINTLFFKFSFFWLILMRLQGDLSSALDRVTGLQQQDVWDEKIHPEKEDNYLTSEIPMDILTVGAALRMALRLLLVS